MTAIAPDQDRTGLRPRVALLLAIAFLVAVFFLLQGDVPAGDALAYAEHANAIATDPAAFFRDPSNHPFAMRVGVTVPLAAIYALLGVSTWTTNLPCLLAAIVIVLVVYAAAPTARARRIGVGFAASSTALVLHGTELNVDLLCGAATAVSLLLLSRRDRPGAAGWIAGAVAVWFVAFLVKESAIWFAPAWLYAIAVDLRALGWRRLLRRYAPALALGLGLAAGYLAVCARVWGDPMARVAGINALAGAHLWTSRGQPVGWWLHRLSYGPPWMFVTTFGVALVVAVVGVRRIAGPHRLWLVATATCLLMFWFGSSSSDEYVPLPLTHRRMLTAALPGVLVLAAVAADALRWRRGWIAAVVVAAALPQIGVIAYRSQRGQPETALHAALHADLARVQGDVAVVCPDVRCVMATPFYYGYRPPARLRVISAIEYAHAPGPTAPRVWAVIKPRRASTNADVGALTGAAIESLGLRQVYWHRRLRLYDAGDGARLHTVLRALVVR